MHVGGLVVFVVVVDFLIFFIVELVGLPFGFDFFDHFFDGVNDEFRSVIIEGVEEVHDDEADEDNFDDGKNGVQTVELTVVYDDSDEVVIAVQCQIRPLGH